MIPVKIEKNLDTYITIERDKYTYDKILNSQVWWTNRFPEKVLLVVFSNITNQKKKKVAKWIRVKETWTEVMKYNQIKHENLCIYKRYRRKTEVGTKFFYSCHLKNYIFSQNITISLNHAYCSHSVKSLFPVLFNTI